MRVNYQVKDVMAAMEEWAPARLAYDWDRSGLNIGNPDQPVSRVIACLSVTREAFDAAARAKAKLIVSHHPAMWDALKTLRLDDPLTRLWLDIAAAGISCFSAHTNLDVAQGGVN